MAGGVLKLSHVPFSIRSLGNFSWKSVEGLEITPCMDVGGGVETPYFGLLLGEVGGFKFLGRGDSGWS